MTRGKIALFAGAIACNLLALLTSARSPEILNVSSEVAPEREAKSELTMTAKASAQPLPRAALHAPTEPDARIVSRRKLFVPPRFQTRPEGEWDGMLVDLNNRPPCSKSENCGMGLACKEGRCMPCVSDNECAQGEACVLDHCLPQEQVSCHSRSDCDASSKCLLNGYSVGVRGNADMRSSCVSRLGGASTPPKLHAVVPPDDRHLDTKLMEQAVQALQAQGG